VSGSGGIRGSGAAHIGAWIGVRAALIPKPIYRVPGSGSRLTFACRRGPAAQPCLLPKLENHRERIDVDLIPPRGLVRLPMQLAVMDPTNRHRELVADPSPQRASLGKAEMMGIRRYPTAHGARLPRDEFKVVLVAQADRFPKRMDCAGARGFAGWRFFAGAPVRRQRRHRGWRLAPRVRRPVPHHRAPIALPETASPLFAHCGKSTAFRRTASGSGRTRRAQSPAANCDRSDQHGCSGRKRRSTDGHAAADPCGPPHDLTRQRCLRASILPRILTDSGPSDQDSLKFVVDAEIIASCSAPGQRLRMATWGHVGGSDEQSGDLAQAGADLS
jgi:hypothetical protein